LDEIHGDGWGVEFNLGNKNGREGINDWIGWTGVGNKDLRSQDIISILSGEDRTPSFFFLRLYQTPSVAEKLEG